MTSEELDIAALKLCIRIAEVQVLGGSEEAIFNALREGLATAVDGAVDAERKRLIEGAEFVAGDLLGGYTNDEKQLETFRHGMQTICNYLRSARSSR